MNHKCVHWNGFRHQCNCGLNQNHTEEEFDDFLIQKGLVPLDSEIQ